MKKVLISLIVILISFSGLSQIVAMPIIIEKDGFAFSKMGDSLYKYKSITDFEEYYLRTGFLKMDNSKIGFSKSTNIANAKEDIILENIYNSSYNKNGLYILHHQNKCGLFSLKELDWKLPLIYDWISDYPESTMKVRLGNKKGFINHKADFILPCIYSSLDRFSNNVIKLGLNVGPNKKRLYGLYDLKERKFVKECVFNSITRTSDRSYFILDSNGVYSMMRKNDCQTVFSGKEMIREIWKFKEPYYEIRENGKSKLIQKETKVILDSNYIDIQYIRLNTGNVLACTNASGKIEFRNFKGELVFNELVDSVYQDRNYVFYFTEKESGALRFWKKFKILFKGQYDSLSNVGYGVIVTKNDKLGLYGGFSNDKFLFNCEYDSISCPRFYWKNDKHIKKLYKGDTIYMGDNLGILANKMGFSKLDFNFIYSYKYNKSKFDVEAVGTSFKNEKFLIDRKGQTHELPLCDSVYNFESDGLILTKRTKKGIYSKTKKELIYPFKKGEIEYIDSNFIIRKKKKIFKYKLSTQGELEQFE